MTPTAITTTITLKNVVRRMYSRLFMQRKAPRLTWRAELGGAAPGGLGALGLPRSRQAPNPAHRIKFLRQVNLKTGEVVPILKGTARG